MVRNVMLGQYIFADTILHRTDPRLKILLLFLSIVSVFMTNTIIGLALFFTFIFAQAIYVGLKAKDIVKTIRFSAVFIFFAILSSIFKDGGENNRLVSYIPITYFGVQLALINSIKVFLVVIVSVLITRTTTPLEFVKGADRLCAPLKRLNINIGELGFIMAVAIRFIPIILEEAKKINTAQKARGIDLNQKGLISHLQNFTRMLGPLFVSTFRRAESLSMAVESKCFGSQNIKTYTKNTEFVRENIVISTLYIIMSIGCIYSDYFFK